MNLQQKNLCQDHLAGEIDRRAFLQKMGKTGVGVGLATFFLNSVSTELLAQGINFKKHSGSTLRLLLNKHPYTDAMIANKANFEKMTGMKLVYDVFPEDVYFDKVTAALSSRSSQYDVFMTGAYQTWQYGPAGWLVDLNDFINDSSKTSSTYNWNDISSNLRSSTAWSGVPGEPLGGRGAKQWALPWGFELNSLSYNARIFRNLKVKVPTSLPDLKEKAAYITKKGRNLYGIGVRGSRSWATIHPGYLSGYVNYGARDFTFNDGKLRAAMNSKASKDFTKLWVEMIQESGPKNWSTYTWYEVGNDLGAGASAMIYDADILGYFMNGTTKEAGNISYAAFTPNPGKKEPTPNVWIWSLAMNNFSKQKDASWYFMQWASGTDHALFGARKKDFINPVRDSVWKDRQFRNRIAKSYKGYLKQYQASAPGAAIYFTPQPLFFNLTTEWAASLQKMVANEVPVDEGLDQLAETVNRQLRQAGLN